MRDWYQRDGAKLFRSVLLFQSLPGDHRGSTMLRGKLVEDFPNTSSCSKVRGGRTDPGGPTRASGSVARMPDGARPAKAAPWLASKMATTNAVHQPPRSGDLRDARRSARPRPSSP